MEGRPALRLITSGPLVGMPAAYYRVGLVDPPWATQAWSPRGESRSAVRKYNTMLLDDMCRIPFGDLFHKDAWLFMWVCGPQLFQSERLMNAWGFKYSGYGFEWVKCTKWGHLFRGLGKTTRGNMELCLLSRRGRARVLCNDIDELIIAPVREHSRKPYEAHRRIERFCCGPRMEIFARQARPGWHRCGNEAPAGPGSWRRFFVPPDLAQEGRRLDVACTREVVMGTDAEP